MRENLSKNEKEEGKWEGEKRGGREKGMTEVLCTLKCESNIFYKLSPVMNSILFSVITTMG